MIRCFVLDDEKYALDIIASFIQRTPSLSLTEASTDPFLAIEMIRAGKIDLLFLDIQMPALTGIQLLKIIGRECKVIITTAYPDYALEGFDLDVIDYLMKPISFERFLRAVNKVESTFVPPSSALPPTPEKTFILLKGDRKNKFHKVYHDDILLIKGMKNYVQVFTTNGTIITYQSLQSLEDQLRSSGFFRVHRSYIVSIAKIRLIDGNVVYINDHMVPVGESYQKDFFELIQKL